jgi:adenine-specific DNA-methyltransferase
MPTLDFKGKQFVYSHHLGVPFRELQVVPEKSLPSKGQQPSLNDNLIIHGDNLEALKALLPTHAAKVDCIFIDPPYNTGNEGWCYNDNVRSPLMEEWLKKSANPVDKEDMERHDKWLCMIWSRLSLLRELLSEDGVIFITIDDNEVHRLIALMDEIYGEKNFISTIAWQKRVSPANDAEFFSTDHDHFIVFSKNRDEFSINKLNRTEGQEDYFSNPDDDARGPWNSGTYTCNKSSEERRNLYYPIVNPNTGKEIWPKKTAVWRYSKERHEENRKLPHP